LKKSLLYLENQVCLLQTKLVHCKADQLKAKKGMRKERKEGREVGRKEGREEGRGGKGGREKKGKEGEKSEGGEEGSEGEREGGKESSCELPEHKDWESNVLHGNAPPHGTQWTLVWGEKQAWPCRSNGILRFTNLHILVAMFVYWP
jgi:hypothetical protein